MAPISVYSPPEPHIPTEPFLTVMNAVQGQSNETIVFPGRITVTNVSDDGTIITAQIKRAGENIEEHIGEISMDHMRFYPDGTQIGAFSYGHLDPEGRMLGSYITVPESFHRAAQDFHVLRQAAVEGHSSSIDRVFLHYEEPHFHWARCWWEDPAPEYCAEDALYLDAAKTKRSEDYVPAPILPCFPWTTQVINGTVNCVPSEIGVLGVEAALVAAAANETSLSPIVGDENSAMQKLRDFYRNIYDPIDRSQNAEQKDNDKSLFKRVPGLGWLYDKLAKLDIGAGEFCQRVSFPGVCGDEETIAGDRQWLEEHKDAAVEGW